MIFEGGWYTQDCCNLGDLLLHGVAFWSNRMSDLNGASRGAKNPKTRRQRKRGGKIPEEDRPNIFERSAEGGTSLRRLEAGNILRPRGAKVGHAWSKAWGMGLGPSRPWIAAQARIVRA